MLRRISVLAPVLLVARPLLASGAEGGGNLLITPKFGLMFWTLLTFILLLVVLRRFAWKPLLGAVEARERSIRESLDQARSGREEAEKLLEKHRAMLAQARRERAEATAAGQKDAERLKTGIIEEGKKQRELLLRQTESQIEAEMQQARVELRGVAADLAIRVAEKLLSSNLDDDAQRRLVEEYLEELERMPGEPGALRS